MAWSSVEAWSLNQRPEPHPRGLFLGHGLVLSRGLVPQSNLEVCSLVMAWSGDHRLKTMDPETVRLKKSRAII